MIENVFHPYIWYLYKECTIMAYGFELSSFEDYIFIAFFRKTKTANFLPQPLNEGFIDTSNTEFNALHTHDDTRNLSRT